MQNKKLKSILIVDDEVDLLAILEEHLSPCAETIYTAKNGAEGFKKVREHKPDVIISDYNMPELNGLELLKRLKEEGIEVPVIWTTGHAQKGLQQKAWQTGVYDIFEKPVDIKRLKDCILSSTSWSPQSVPAQQGDLATKLSNKRIDLLIDSKTYDLLVTHCKNSGVSASTFIGQIIKEELKKAA